MKAFFIILRLLNPVKLGRLVVACRKHGKNLMALMAYAKSNSPDVCALYTPDETITYAELYRRSRLTATHMRAHHGLAEGDEVLLIGRNSIPFVAILIALSGLGVHVSLLSPSLTASVYGAEINRRKNYRLIIADSDVDLPLGLSVPVEYLKEKAIDCQNLNPLGIIRSKRPARITVFTSGSTGQSKEAPRSPGLRRFAVPLWSISRKLHINTYQGIFIAVPLFHGFGLASLLMSCFYSKTVYLQRRFDAGEVLETVERCHVECVALVPLMLQKMAAHSRQGHAALKCIISGGDALRQELVEQSSKAFGLILFNLYGTSEAGVCILATPADLARYPGTLGKCLSGAAIRLLDTAGTDVADGNVGEVAVSASWSIASGHSIIRTGDLALRNRDGYYFLKGRTDDRMVIAGENVYPLELEQLVCHHPAVDWAKVQKTSDLHGNDQIGLILGVSNGMDLSEKELSEWMQHHVSKHLIPFTIEFSEQRPVSKLM